MLTLTRSTVRLGREIARYLRHPRGVLCFGWLVVMTYLACTGGAPVCIALAAGGVAVSTQLEDLTQ